MWRRKEQLYLEWEGSMNIKVSGLEEAKRKLDSLVTQLAPTIFRVNMGMADQIVQESRELAPFKTGALRRSITITDTDEATVSVVIEAQVPYAGYVEYGTSRMVAQPYMQPAIMKARMNWAREIINGLVRITR